MMNTYPIRFKRVTASFNEVIAQTRFCDGTDHHFPDDSTELSDLINSFIERRNEEEEEVEEEKYNRKKKFNLSESYLSISEMKKMLRNLLGKPLGVTELDEIKETIREETELASIIIETNSSSEGFKRSLVNRLRDRGFDAGLCKSSWDKMSGFPAGEYEYVDIFVDGTRYIIEVALAGEFSIARPTKEYLSLLGEFPRIFVGKPDELKQIVKIMSLAAKESMKSNNMHLPPWRRNGYMEAKWFGSHKRLTNVGMAKKMWNAGGRRSEGIEPSTLATYHYYRRGEVVGN